MIARSSLLYPFLAFLIAILIGGGMTWSVWLVETQRAQTEFERTADLAIDRVVTSPGWNSTSSFCSPPGACSSPSAGRWTAMSLAGS